MIDIKFLRENPDIVKENIKNKFQMHKLPLVDEVIELDNKNRELKLHGDELRAQRNALSNQIGGLMRDGKKDEAEQVKAEVKKINDELVENEKLENEYSEKVTNIMMKIPNIMHESVPIGMVSRWFLIMRFHIILILWRVWLESIWMLLVGSLEMVFII